MKREVIFGVNGLTFREEEFTEAKRKESPLTLDMAIPSSCRNRCIYCGWSERPSGQELSQKEIFDFFRQFYDIGGKSVRILGRGEPLSRTDILDIFGFMNDLGLIPVLFSCGDVLGDDNYAQDLHGMSGEELLRELKARGVSILLKYEKEDEDQITGVEGYSKKRNLALERILKGGFNLFSPSHVGLASVVLSQNLEDLPSIYELGLGNNVYPFFCPLMPIGRARDDSYRRRIGISQKEIIDLAVKLHILAFQHGIEYKHPSDFPGTLPCFITRAGFYLDDFGNAFLCESDEHFGNIRERSLEELWRGLNNRKRELHGVVGCNEGKCFPKRRISVIPERYDGEVDQRVREYIKKHPKEFGSKGNFVYV